MRGGCFGVVARFHGKVQRRRLAEELATQPMSRPLPGHVRLARAKYKKDQAPDAGMCDAPPPPMSMTRFAVALGFVAGALLGCTKEPGHPSSSVGQTEAQAESPPNEAIQPPNEAPRTTRAAPAPTMASAGMVDLPPGTSLAGDSAVTCGTDRFYRTDLTYPDAVGYFDRLRSSAGCEKTSRMTTETATFWSLRCPGATAHVAVRKTLPTTIEVLAGSD